LNTATAKDDQGVVDGTAEEIKDAELAPDEAVEEAPPPQRPAPAPAPAQDLVHRPQGSTSLIQADSPAEQVERASAIATQLDKIVRAQGMRTKVGSQKKLDPETGEPARDEQGREIWVPRWHVNVEAWQTLATLLGLAVVPVWTRRVIDPLTGQPEKVAFDVKERTYHPKREGGGLKAERTYTVEGFSWEARVEVFKDGVLIGAGEGMCGRTEGKWKEADDYAVRGMASTRATSRAIGAAARWIVTLAGYQATPAEEMPGDDAKATAEAARLALADEALAGKAKLALGYLVALNGDPAKVSAQTDGAAARDVWHQLAVEFGTGETLPAVAAAALRAAATGRRRRHEEASRQAGSSQSEATTSSSAEPEEEGPPPDYQPREFEQDGAPLPGTVPEDDEGASDLCICPNGLATEVEFRVEECPVIGHGIPF
jgi:hypothetical protein